MKLSVCNLSKSYGGWDVFSDFSLEVPAGVRLCVCGPNGCGKSTFLRILAGVAGPDGGKVSYPAHCRLGYVEQELPEDSLDTPLLEWVLDVLPDWNDFWNRWETASQQGDEALLRALGQRQAELEGMYGYNPEHRARTVLSGLGFVEAKWTRTLRELSGGWRERAKLARVLTAGADMLLLDEPTNHLDLDAVEWLERFLLEYKGVLVFVAHDRVFMDKVGTHVLYLGGNKPVYRPGTFSHVLGLLAEHEARKEREAQRMVEEVERKMDFVRRFKAKASKARQANSRKKQIERIERELDNITVESRRKTLGFAWPTPARADKIVLHAMDLTFVFADGVRLWPALDFQLYRGQKIALVGPNGCGKSTLLKLVAGQLEKEEGAIACGTQVRMGYFSQHQLDTLQPSNTVLAEIRRLSDPRSTEEELMSVLGLFMLGQAYFDRQVATLSGGEKSRLTLATLFLARCNFLVLDEPTNHLDLESREALVEALEHFPGTLLMVAHDRGLLARVAEQVWELGTEGFTVFERGYEQWDEARKQRRILWEAEKDTSGSLSGTGVSREEQKRIKRVQAELRNALHRELKPRQEAYARQEIELEKLLAEQAAIETELADPAIYADSHGSTALLQRFHEVQTRSEALMEAMSLLEQEMADIEARKEMAP